MIESLSLDDLQNVGGAVLLELDALPAQGVESCTQYAWSADLRRCYAAADRYAQTVAGNLKWR